MLYATMEDLNYFSTNTLNKGESRPTRSHDRLLSTSSSSSYSSSSSSQLKSCLVGESREVLDPLSEVVDCESGVM